MIVGQSTATLGCLWVMPPRLRSCALRMRGADGAARCRGALRVMLNLLNKVESCQVFKCAALIQVLCFGTTSQVQVKATNTETVSCHIELNGRVLCTTADVDFPGIISKASQSVDVDAL